MIFGYMCRKKMFSLCPAEGDKAPPIKAAGDNSQITSSNSISTPDATGVIQPDNLLLINVFISSNVNKFFNYNGLWTRCFSTGVRGPLVARDVIARGP